MSVTALSTFRFTNAALQARLVAAIAEAGLVHRVAEDGTLLHQPGQCIERCVDQIVDSVFSAGYYRAEITDRDLAERYRRFTKRRGTTVVEEIRNGRTYFVQAIREKIFRHRGIPTHVCLAILGEDLDPDRVTERLGTTPTFACRKGESLARPYSRRRLGAPLRPSHLGRWELRSLPHVESNDVMPHLIWLLDLVEPMAAELERIVGPPIKDGVRIVQLDLVGPHRIGGCSLPGPVLRRLSTLCDRLDVSYSPDDYE